MPTRFFRLKACTWCNTAEQLGGGGEGRVFRVRGHPDLAAKVYHPDCRTAARRRKLELMLANPPEDPMAGRGHHSIAWPVDLLSERPDAGACGYLMPILREMLPVHQVYNLRARLDTCPGLGYRHLYGVAANVASAVAALHAKGYVVGDVNESNVLVLANSWTSVVDVDSFQVFDPRSGSHILCPVFTPQFTAPELQGKDVASVVRTQDHDGFGLGVLVFLLLMEGFHPFRARFLGAAEPPGLEARIATGLYPYAGNGLQGAPRGMVEPPPGSIPYAVLPAEIQGLFDRCFVAGHRHSVERPQAHEWRSVLRAVLDRGFAICNVRSSHEYPAHLLVCPWCERESLLGVDPFPGSSRSKATRQPRRPAAPNTHSLQQAPGTPVPPTMPPNRWSRLGRFTGATAVVAVLIFFGVAISFHTPARTIDGFAAAGRNAQGYEEYTHEATGIRFVLLPAGRFRMGSPESEELHQHDEDPVHDVELSPFLIAKHEVSQAEWKKVMGSNPSRFSGDQLPVETVSWNDCQSFCRKTGLKLPSEAEWEYACRGGTTAPFSFGQTISREQVNYDGNMTVVVNSFPPNGFGLHQMHGNIWEWCEDVYEQNFYSTESAKEKDPVCTSGTGYRVYRGGGWIGDALSCRAANRNWVTPSDSASVLGFRPAHALP